MQVSVAGERCNVIVVASKRLGGGQKMHHGWWLVTHGPKRLDTSFSKEKGYTCTADDVFFFWKKYTSTYIKSTKEFGYTNGTGATSLPYSGNHLHWWSTGKFVNRHAGHHHTKQHSEEERKVEKGQVFSKSTAHSCVRVVFQLGYFETNVMPGNLSKVLLWSWLPVQKLANHALGN